MLHLTCWWLHCQMVHLCMLLLLLCRLVGLQRSLGCLQLLVWLQLHGQRPEIRRRRRRLSRLHFGSCSKCSQLLLPSVSCGATSQTAGKSRLRQHQRGLCRLAQLLLQVLLPLAQLLPCSSSIKEHLLQDLLLKRQLPLSILDALELYCSIRWTCRLLLLLSWGTMPLCRQQSLQQTWGERPAAAGTGLRTRVGLALPRLLLLLLLLLLLTPRLLRYLLTGMLVCACCLAPLPFTAAWAGKWAGWIVGSIQLRALCCTLAGCILCCPSLGCRCSGRSTRRRQVCSSGR
jgi:hypothetical protein